MKGLLVKDIRIAAEQKMLLLIVLVCSIICLFTMKDPTFVVGYTCLICATLGSTTCAYDEMNNGMAFLQTLPFSRKTYIIEKYLFSVGIGLTAWVFGTLAALIYMLLTKTKPDGEFLLSIAIFIVPVLFIPSIMIPIILQFGHAKSRIVVFVLVGISLAIGGLTALFGSTQFSVAYYDGTVTLMSFGAEKAMSFVTLALAGIAVSAVLLVISMFVSLAIYKRKEY